MCRSDHRKGKVDLWGNQGRKTAPGNEAHCESETWDIWFQSALGDPMGSFKLIGVPQGSIAVFR